MGSCVSIIHKISMSSSSPLVPQDLDDSRIIIPNSTPIKENNMKSFPNPTTAPAIVDPRILSLRLNSQASRLGSPLATYRSFGSQEEVFYETQAWLDSDCDDDFHSVAGDFSSRGSTPSNHSAMGTPRLTRVFSPQINRTVSQGRPPLPSGSSLSRGSTPAHQRNSSSHQANGTYPEIVPSPNRDFTPTTKKKKKLADLFRESIRERAGEFLAIDGEWFDKQAESNNKVGPHSPASVLPPKPGKLRTHHVSEAVCQSNSSGKITPADDNFADSQKTLKSQHCCFPRISSIRSYRENQKPSDTPNPSHDFRA